MTGDTAHLRTGRQGEDAAERFLRDRGWAILDRNWRQGRLELDLVCKDREYVVFVEVKTRKESGLTRPGEAFTRKKQRNVILAARAWLAAHKAWSQPCRFDLVSVTCRNNVSNLELVSHVIELGPELGMSLGGGYTSWQPW